MTPAEILVCIDAIAPVRAAPDPQAARMTELLFGEEFVPWSEQAGIVHGTTRTDNVEGFVPADALAPKSGRATHRVRRTFVHVYPSPDLVASPDAILPLNALVELTGRSAPLRYPGGGPGSTVVQLRSGEWITEHGASPIDHFAADVNSVAAMFIGATYLHGGKTWLGCDGPGLIQTVLAACGIDVPRHIGPQMRFFESRRSGDDDRLNRAADLVVFSDSACGFRFDETIIAARPESMLVESIASDEFAKSCAGPIRTFPLRDGASNRRRS